MAVIKLLPACKEAIWGGRKLIDEYKKEYDGANLAETWELSVHPDGTGTVATGADAGLSFTDYIAKHGKGILGTNCERFADFPILIKLIDAKKDLSVQVHPDDAYAQEHEGQYGKTEMWVVLEAEPGASLCLGLKKEVSAAELRRHIGENTLDQVLNMIPVKKGDVIFIPAKTIHAIGGGIVVAEIQQNSNVTYRVYDYGRVGADGKPRELHVEKALAVAEMKPPKTDYDFGGHIGACDVFVVDMIHVGEGAPTDGAGTSGQTAAGQAVYSDAAGTDSFVSLLVVDGSARITCGGETVEANKGDSLFVEAGSGAYTIEGNAAVIKTTIPPETPDGAKNDGAKNASAATQNGSAQAATSASADAPAFRIEHDSMGEMRVPADKYWGAQTQRSRENFCIGVGTENMPREIIAAFAVLKKAAARANRELVPDRMTAEKCQAIEQVCDEIAEGQLWEHFPLVVWQTGSGTQSNMNVNEVIAGRGNEIAGKKLLHPNDDVNMSQSSNDTFPTALHICAAMLLEDRLIPAAKGLVAAFYKLEEENRGIVKSGRTHLQDAVPISFSQEISGWRSSVERDIEMLCAAVKPLKELALGGTAVGTGLNAPKGFDTRSAAMIAELTGTDFVTAGNKFHALSSRDELVYAHGAVKALAADLMKIANDVRWLASGPRCGLGEITIPENEPGSSIMPGKVNPTQCEQATMVAAQVMGNDVTIGIAAGSGNFQLNVFLPVIAYNFIQSSRLLAESITSFTENCVTGIRPNKEKMHENLHRSLMLGTALNPYIGYENAAKCAHKACEENISLKEACVTLGFLTPERFDEVFHPEEMTMEN